MFYWPTATPAPSDLGCSDDDSFPSPTSPTVPGPAVPPPTPMPTDNLKTAVILGHTFTSPSALIILGHVGATTPAKGYYSTIQTCGIASADVVLKIAQSELRTVWTKSRDEGTSIPSTTITESFNFADLEIAPYSKIIGEYCDDTRLPRDRKSKEGNSLWCSTDVDQATYQPSLSLPNVIRSLDTL
jgi:hypothetical protein